MKHTVQTGNDCVSIDGREHSLREAADFAYQISVAVNMVRIHDEIAHAAERMAHDSLRDQREEGDRL